MSRPIGPKHGPYPFPYEGLPTERHDVILADPPWLYHEGPNKFDLGFPQLSKEELSYLPIRQLLSPSGILFLWTTSKHLNQALSLISDWKLNYRGVAFIWIKTKRDGTPLRAMGPRPSIVKPTTEMVLAASKVKFGRPLPLDDISIPQVIFDCPFDRPICQKPEQAHEYIERMYPRASKLEMFARKKRLGWKVWGNETTKYD